MKYEEMLADLIYIVSGDDRDVSSVFTEETPKSQKFKHGVFVNISNNLPNSMSHFKCGVPAMILYSYYQGCGRRNGHDSYALLIRNEKNMWTYSAWYEEDQLTEVTDSRTLKVFDEEIKLFRERIIQKIN